MGLAALGPRWRRRIAMATGLEIAWASGGGAYEFNFTTTDHRHGVFNLKAYRGYTDGPVWWLVDKCPNFSSCHELFPEDRTSP